MLQLEPSEKHRARSNKAVAKVGSVIVVDNDFTIWDDITGASIDCDPTCRTGMILDPTPSINDGVMLLLSVDGSIVIGNTCWAAFKIIQEKRQ